MTNPHYETWGKSSDEAVIPIHGYGMDRGTWPTPALEQPERVNKGIPGCPR